MAGIYTAIEETLQPALKQILEEIGYTDTLVIFSHQNGLEPTNTYCIINFLQIEQLGFKDEATFIMQDQDYLEFVTHYNLNTQITFCGKEAPSTAFDFRHSLINNRRSIDILSQANYGILTRGDIRRIPEKRETQWVECHNMDIDFSFAVLTRQTYDWATSFVVNGNIIPLPDGE